MTFTTTRRAAYASFVVQAIVNNLAPLLFVVFHARLGIDVARLGLLAGLNFLVQLLTDLAAVKVVDRVGYRAPMVLAHALAALGLVLMALLPQLLASPFAGLCLAAVVYAIGGGLIEVLASPVVEHLPAEPGRSKESGMALLHSFYCWGQLSVVVASTALLTILGMGAWWVLPLVWAAVPAVNAVLMTRVPVPATVPDHERTSLIGLVGSPVFLLVLLLMAAGGASELTMSQWSSFFAQHRQRCGRGRLLRGDGVVPRSRGQPGRLRAHGTVRGPHVARRDLPGGRPLPGGGRCHVRHAGARRRRRRRRRALGRRSDRGRRWHGLRRRTGTARGSPAARRRNGTAPRPARVLPRPGRLRGIRVDRRALFGHRLLACFRLILPGRRARFFVLRGVVGGGALRWHVQRRAHWP